jgi:hypothetical protein
MYTVFCIYYKYGQFNVDVLENDDSLRKYCMEQLEKYDEDHDIVDYEGIEDLNILIDKTIEYGKEFVSEQSGWGVVSIVKGDNLIKYGGKNTMYHSRC